MRNREDGDVEIAADGDASALEAFRRLLRDGPPGADVREVRDAGQTPEDLPNPFTILR